DPATLERLLQRYTGVQGAQSATAYIAPACARLRQAIARQQEGGDVSAELAAVGMPAAPEAAAAQTLPQDDGAAPAGAVPAVQRKEAPGGARDARTAADGPPRPRPRPRARRRAP